MTLLAPRVDPAAPRGRLMLVLLAGRGAFRATSQLAPVALAATWGTVGFADYAGAIGVSAWTVFVAASGEKAALKLVPRTRRLGPAVARVVLRVAAVPLVLAAAAVPVSLLLPGSQLVAAALLWSAALGLLQVAVGLHRVRGHPRVDAVTYTALTAAILVLSAATFHFGWSPLRQLVLLSVLGATGAAVLLYLLPPGWVRRPPAFLEPARRRRIGLLVLRSCALLGLPELVGSACVSVCYLALRLSGHRTDNGAFYVAVMMSGFASAALVYLLRLRQPATSMRLRGPAGRAGRASARRILRLGLVVCAAGLPAIALVPPGRPLLAVLTCLEVPLFALVVYAGYLVENTDGRSPLLTAGSAVVTLVAAAVGAAVLVPAGGAAGAMGALLLSLGATALALDTGLGRRRHGRN